MHPEHIPMKASGASAADKINEIIRKLGDLQNEVYHASCFSVITHSAIEDVFFRDLKINDRAGSYYCGDDDRKVLGFVSSELSIKTSDLEKQVDALHEMMCDLRDGLLKGGAA